MNIDYIERIETLDSAAETLREAIDLIEAAVAGTGEERLANSYILPHLRSWLNDSRQSSYCSIEDLKSALVQEEPDPEDGIPTEPEPTQEEIMENVKALAATEEYSPAGWTAEAELHRDGPVRFLDTADMNREEPAEKVEILEDETARKEMTEDEMTDYLRTK